MGGRYHGIDESVFSTPDSAMDLLWNSIRNGLSFNKYDNKTRFTAQVLSPPVPISPSSHSVYLDAPISTKIRFMFKARILGSDSPHLLLPNPCNLEYVENPSDALEMISLHTTFVSEAGGLGEEWPAINDTVIVELYPGFTKNAYNLQHGSYVGISDNTTGASAGDAEGGDRTGTNDDCSTMAAKIDEMLQDKVPGLLATAKQGPPPSAAGYPIATKCTTSEYGGGDSNSRDVSVLLGPAGWQTYKETLGATEGAVDSVNQWGYVGRFQFGIAAMAAAGAVDETKALANIQDSIKTDFPGKTTQWHAAKANKCYGKQSNIRGPNSKCRTSGNKVVTSKSKKYGGRSAVSPLSDCCGKHIVNAYSKADTWTDAAVKAGVNSLDKFRAAPKYQEDIMIGYTNANLATLKRLGANVDITSPADIAGTLAAAHLVGPGGAAKMKKGVIVTDANKTDPRKYYNRQVEAANKLCPPESMVPHSDQYLSDLKANTPPEGSVADSYRLSLFDYDTYEV